MQHKLQYNTTVAMQDNTVQHWWCSTKLAASTISNTGKVAKIVHPEFLVKMVKRILITQLQKIDDCR